MKGNIAFSLESHTVTLTDAEIGTNEGSKWKEYNSGSQLLEICSLLCANWVHKEKKQTLFGQVINCISR